MRLLLTTVGILCTVTLNVAAQKTCVNSAQVSGIIFDSTRAVISGASVTLDKNLTAKTDHEGRFTFGCIQYGHHAILVTADSFEDTRDKFEIKVTDKEGHSISIIMRPQTVEAKVDVGDDMSDAVSPNRGGGSKILSHRDLVELADDPDDFQRELQTLAATGGASGTAIFTVDGFQTESRLPPKASIDFIRINPDLFAAEYAEPPFDGARVEVYTKPGQDAFHGSVFIDSSNSFLNAKDPLATSRAAIGKERYGFDLSGPIRAKRIDFSLGLERRDIHNFAVVNAVDIDSSGNLTKILENSPTPQQLWIGSARIGWQLNTKNTFSFSYIANVNALQNLGVGGTTLTESGYSSNDAEHSLRATNVTTLSAKLMHEVRGSIRWRNTIDTPNATTPQLMVAGAFTSGGATIQSTKNRETAIELDDDIIVASEKHLLKLGVQINAYLERLQAVQNFNGTYIFGGGNGPALNADGTVIPGVNVAMTALEQYRRTMLLLPGGTPSAYLVTQGSPNINFTQERIVAFAEDQWKLKARLALSLGFRYALQTSPLTFANMAPRIGIAWSPDTKSHWILRAHAGLFNSPITTATYSEALRLDGKHRITSTVYSPTFGSPTTSGLSISTIRQLAPKLEQNPFSEAHLGVERSFGEEWHGEANIYFIQGWDSMRTRNVNSPLNNSPDGPRPGIKDLDVLQFQQSGRTGGTIAMVSVDGRPVKAVQLFSAYIRNGLRSNADGPTFTPQSSFTDAGETARQSTQITHRVILFAQAHLPKKITLATTMDLASGMPFNILTGNDNNGDGVFNDRPTYAKLGNPSAIVTRYGLLTPTGGIGVLPRNTGTMPWTAHLDLNISRSFSLKRRSPSASQKAIAINIRSANVLNHTNVTSVGNILGSPLFAQSVTADTGRRIEFGLRASF